MNPDSVVPEVTEKDLLQRIAVGDEAAFEQLYDRLAGLLYQLAVSVVHDFALAEEVVQESFLQIWDKAPNYDPQLGKPIAWAVTLTRNKAIDRLRGSQRRERIADALGMEQEAQGENVLDGTAETLVNEMARQVRSAMIHLPEEQRQAIELAFFDGLTQTEIAAKLGLPLGTVKARIRRGMLQMRDELKDDL